MRRWQIVALGVAIGTTAFLGACDNGTHEPTAPSADRGLVGAPEGPMMGIHWARGEHPGAAGAHGRRQPGNMTLHNGYIMPSSRTYSIFWGPTWSTSAGDKITGINAFLGGFGGSNYIHASTEYAGIDGVRVSTTSAFGGSFTDLSAAPTNAPQVSTVQNEVCKVLAANGVAPRADGIYNVYASTTRGGAGYCAWHSYGSCNGVNVQFAWYFNLDGDSGCDPGTPYGSYTSGHTNSQGLAAIANVTAHEVSETITDPRNGGWYDSQNGENADKCAWSFSPNNGGLVTLTNGGTYQLQMEWSNAAFTAGTGYSNRYGQAACLDGIVKF